ncbi:MAG: universal stress protein [Actinomycetaceae bacterium]|nr:universal stress protein [Actinomycetaceae bacterium]
MGVIVAGTDGSQQAQYAAELAAEEAIRRELPLHLIYAFAPIYGRAEMSYSQEAIMGNCKQVLDAEEERLRALYPQVQITTEVAVNDPALALIEKSSEADTVYVGARGLGTIRRMFLGSVSRKVATYSQCPCVVVLDRLLNPEGPVVVGMAPDDGAPRAVEYAMKAAQNRNTTVQVIQAQQHAAANVGFLETNALRELVEQGMANVAEETRYAFEAMLKRYPDVNATFEITSEHAVDALAAAAENASLVVVGSQAAAMPGVRILGSVAAGILQAAPVVAVVPTTDF